MSLHQVLICVIINYQQKNPKPKSFEYKFLLNRDSWLRSVKALIIILILFFGYKVKFTYMVRLFISIHKEDINPLHILPSSSSLFDYRLTVKYDSIGTGC